MQRGVSFGGAAVALVGIGWPGPAAAHAFAQRYDLPIPLWLFVAGAGAAVALSFVAMVLFPRETPGLRGYPRFDLLAHRPSRWLAHPAPVFILRLVAVALFLLIVTAGLFGAESPFRNIAPTLIWVIWWVGVAYLSALVGDVWAVLNPWRTLFAWAEAFYRRFRPGGGLSLGLWLPAWVGVWPAVLLFLAFAWMEIVSSAGDSPRLLATAILIYSAVTIAGMALFGAEPWLRAGEAFSVAFGLLARFAPLEVRTTDDALCRSCGAATCADGGGCINCYDCFTRAAPAARQWNLRPYAVGLLTEGPVHPSSLAFVLAMLATVSFDGFTETPLWGTIQDTALGNPTLIPILTAARDAGADVLKLIASAGLFAFPLIFFAVYILFAAVMTAAAGPGAGHSVGSVARLFVLNLVPIALAYHLAHYLSYLLVAGQLVIPLASDPFGFGWNLFGTNLYRLDIGIVGSRFVWYTSVIAIVLGHMAAVYLAHVMAERAFPDRRTALRSQAPMLVLMVGYTMVSLWILAQPVVTG